MKKSLKCSIASGLASLLFAGFAHAASSFVAIESQRTVGNQGNWDGILGNDFYVNSEITVTALGAFDSLQDGFGGKMIQVGIFSIPGAKSDPEYARTGPGVLVGTVVSIGDADSLIGKTRWQPVSFNLIPGRYSVVALGFTDFGNVNGNTYSNTAAPFPLMNTGSGLIDFGTPSAPENSRYERTSIFKLPSFNYGPPAQYDAGTFMFQAAVSPIPEPGEWTMMLTGLIVVGFVGARKSKSTRPFVFVVR